MRSRAGICWTCLRQRPVLKAAKESVKIVSQCGKYVRICGQQGNGYIGSIAGSRDTAYSDEEHERWPWPYQDKGDSGTGGLSQRFYKHYTESAARHRILDLDIEPKKKNFGPLATVVAQRTNRPTCSLNIPKKRFVCWIE